VLGYAFGEAQADAAVAACDQRRLASEIEKVAGHDAP
jgi:hypothetical protein